MGRDSITVTRRGESVFEITAEFVALDYPELSGRAEANMALAPNGDIWAAVGNMTGQRKRPERIFRSADGGKTWSQDTYHISEGQGYPASVSLPDGTIVTVTGNTLLDAKSRPLEPWSVQAILWRLPENNRSDPRAEGCR